MAGVISLNILKYLDKLVILFDEHLSLTTFSKQTRKNYKSDITAFFTWLRDTPVSATIKINTQADLLKTIKRDNILEYKQWLVISQTPPATINRRLSALRSFSAFQS